jgi:hypothetical protein
MRAINSYSKIMIMNKSAVLKVAGAAALAGSTQAYGQIVQLSLPANLTLPTPTNSEMAHPDYFRSFASEDYTVQPSSSIGTDFYFSAFYSRPTPYFGTGVYPMKIGNGVAGTYIGGTFYASGLAAGTKIGTDTTLTFDTQTAASLATYNNLAILAGSSDGMNSQNTSTLLNAQQPNMPVYLGFQFVDGQNNVHDGWLELNSTLSGDPSSPGGLTFLGGAYNSVADTGDGTGDILVGEVPEPGTISSLVMGAAALGCVGLMRRRRAAVATAQD